MIFPHLISYAYFSRDKDMTRVLEVRDEARAAGHDILLFFDSGAFTASTQGKPVTVDEYSEWLSKWGGHATAYANLDVIYDWRATQRNQRILEDRGFTPLPVFHMGDDYALLRDLIDEYRYIALGGLGMSRTRVMRHFVKAFRLLKTTRRRVRYHAFGQVNLQALDFPFLSGDASSWMAAGRFGGCSVYNPTTHSLVRITTGNRGGGLPTTLAQNADLLRRYGWHDPYELVGAHWRVLDGLGAASVLAMQAAARRRHGPVKLAGYPDGPTLWMVAPTTGHLEAAWQNYQPTDLVEAA